MQRVRSRDRIRLVFQESFSSVHWYALRKEGYKPMYLNDDIGAYRLADNTDR